MFWMLVLAICDDYFELIEFLKPDIFDKYPVFV